jgi:hypothetical protein
MRRKARKRRKHAKRPNPWRGLALVLAVVVLVLLIKLHAAEGAIALGHLILETMNRAS